VNGRETELVIVGEQQESEPSPMGRDYGLTSFPAEKQAAGLKHFSPNKRRFSLRACFKIRRGACFRAKGRMAGATREALRAATT
jgi:hypothetical protein